MKNTIRSFALLLISLLSCTVLAGNISENSFDKVMALSGLNKQTAEIPAMVMAGMDRARQRESSISDVEFRDMQKPIKDAFLPSKILRTIGNEIRRNTTESEAKDLLTWYESDSGRKITRAEENASNPVAYQEMLREAQSLLADKKRVDFAKRIDYLVNATNMSMELQENTGVAVFSAISIAMNPSQPVNIDDFKTQMTAQNQQMRANVEKLVILSLVYSYKNLDEANIEKYIKFLEQPNSRKFNENVINGMKLAFNQSIDAMAKSMASIFKKYNSK